MIKGFRHKGLKRLFETDDQGGVNPQHVRRIKVILLQLHTAEKVRNMAAPGYDLHPLKGGRRGQWAVKVNANWRITFSFDGEGFDNVDLVDYH